MSAIARESRTFLEVYFKEIFDFCKTTGEQGLQATEKYAAIKPIRFVSPMDGKAVMEVLGRGVGAKIAHHFCPYCSCHSNELCQGKNTDNPYRCSTCAASNTAICRHWPVEDRDTIIRINDEIQALTDYNYVLNPEFINDAKRIKHLECNHRPNSLFKEDNIQFQYETSSSMLLKLPEIKFVN